jgi:hypothetical protein
MYVRGAYWCNTCSLGYYSIGAQNPDQAYYFYRYTFYTVPEMERICRLKAFL